MDPIVWANDSKQASHDCNWITSSSPVVYRTSPADLLLLFRWLPNGLTPRQKDTPWGSVTGGCLVETLPACWLMLIEFWNQVINQTYPKKWKLPRHDSTKLITQRVKDSSHKMCQGENGKWPVCLDRKLFVPMRNGDFFHSCHSYVELQEGIVVWSCMILPLFMDVP